MLLTISPQRPMPEMHRQPADASAGCPPAESDQRPPLRSSAQANQGQQLQCPRPEAPRRAFIMPESQPCAGPAELMAPWKDSALAASAYSRPAKPILPPGQQWSYVFSEVYGVMPVVPAHQLCVQQASAQPLQAGRAPEAPASATAPHEPMQLLSMPSSRQMLPASRQPSQHSRKQKGKRQVSTVPELRALESIPHFLEYWDTGDRYGSEPVKAQLQSLPRGRRYEWQHAAAHIMSEAEEQGKTPEQAAAWLEVVRNEQKKTVAGFIKAIATKESKKSKPAANESP